ncbi:type II secretion system F family protein [Pararobbsia silviterrae]|uniref:Type II secretion system F family protein n=1 Tax=Pararobbsia silviterrae TaxID=1792498 RepID=A0A494XIR4_9BURK|nr:type II secretion system F family protein [Pararobbsia silviterrae]RKP48526.1 type II secretion system F family protein [Pararobbsia silviterrae]
MSAFDADPVRPPSTSAHGDRVPYAHRVHPVHDAKRGRRARITPAHVTAALRQLASLLRVGLPLLAALDIMIASATRPALKRLFGTVRHDMLQGLTLNAALARHPRHFDDRCRALLAIGEASGALVDVLDQIVAEHQRQRVQRAKLRAAMTYPACLLVFCVAIVVVLTHWVIPAFEDIFKSFDAALPPATRLVLATSHRIATAAPYVTAGSIACGLACVVAFRRSTTLRHAAARYLLAAPVAGPLLKRAFAAQWCRALGVLLRAGVPLADALDILAATRGHPAYTTATADTVTRIRRGERLGHALARHRLFPDSITVPIAVAEQTGALDTLLIDLATLVEQELEWRIATLLNLVEPLLVALLGLLIGGLVITLYLPIIELGRVV